jgi:nitrite reductase/ring-hydroxylating ferredoxin subunit
MKKILLFLIIPFLIGCDSNNSNNRNPNIPNVSFSIPIDVNLPTNNGLKFAGNGLFVPNGGSRGIIVFNTGSGYNAFDAACPNDPASDCATLSISDINAVCGCDNAKYSLFTGLCSGKQYPLKQYKVEVKGDVIRVYN